MKRTVENIRRIRSLVSNIFFVMMITVGLGAAIHSIQAGELSVGIPLGEAVIGIATLILAFATFYLAFSEMIEGIDNREQIEKEAEKDRRRLRLKEQLEGMYSPLIANIDLIKDRSQHNYREGPVVTLMDDIRTKYEFLAEPTLKVELRGYYNPHHRLWLEENCDLHILPLRDIILDDYESLLQEYEGLTKSVNN